jgi:predicted transcriptional regulator
MNIETRKINLINWISSIQEEDILAEMEKIQQKKADWWNTISNEDKEAINDGLEQLDKGEFLTRSQVRNKIKDKYNF